jgi:hypothetical protein
MDTKLSGDQAYHKIEPQLVAELTGKEPKRQKRYTQKGEYVPLCSIIPVIFTTDQTLWHASSNARML